MIHDIVDTCLRTSLTLFMVQGLSIKIIDPECLLVKMSQKASAEIHAPDAVAEFKKAYVLANERRCDHDPGIGVPADGAVLEDAHHLEIPGIIPR